MYRVVCIVYGYIQNTRVFSNNLLARLNTTLLRRVWTLQQSCRVNSSTHVANVSGNWNNGSNTGLFHLNLNNATSNSNSNIGSHLMFYSKYYGYTVILAIKRMNCYHLNHLVKHKKLKSYISSNIRKFNILKNINEKIW